MIPVSGEKMRNQIKAIKKLVLSEVNVKELEFMSEDSDILVKNIKANFKMLGPKYGKQMKAIASAISNFNQVDINQLEKENSYLLDIDGTVVNISKEDVFISSQDIPALLVANNKGITVALDVNISAALREEGIARELVNRIQNMRKDAGLEVTDRIRLSIAHHDLLEAAISSNEGYICGETLTDQITLSKEVPKNSILVEFDEIKTYIAIAK